jgi:hypothetical protein
MDSMTDDRQERYELFSWGLKNQILISAEAIPTPKKHWATPDVKLIYNVKGRATVGKQVFEQDTKEKRELITEKIYEAYRFYRNKYGD